MTISPAARAAATSALAAAVLSLGLTGCGSDTAGADRAAAAAGDRATTPSTTAPSNAAAEDDAAPDTSAGAAPGTALEDVPEAVDPSHQFPKDDVLRVEFPGVAAVFDDGSSAGVDGDYLLVTTAAEENRVVSLPTDAAGWISQVLVDLGDAGNGYLVTQSAGEYLQTSLAVLHDGDLTLATPDTEVPFGDSTGQGGPAYETFTTGNGAHLYTRVVGEGFYEWSVEGTTLVPTLVATEA